MLTSKPTRSEIVSSNPVRMKKSQKNCSGDEWKETLRPSDENSRQRVPHGGRCGAKKEKKKKKKPNFPTSAERLKLS